MINSETSPEVAEVVFSYLDKDHLAQAASNEAYWNFVRRSLGTSDLPYDPRADYGRVALSLKSSRFYLDPPEVGYITGTIFPWMLAALREDPPGVVERLLEIILPRLSPEKSLEFLSRLSYHPTPNTKFLRRFLGARYLDEIPLKGAFQAHLWSPSFNEDILKIFLEKGITPKDIKHMVHYQNVPLRTVEVLVSVGFGYFFQTTKFLFELLMKAISEESFSEYDPSEHYMGKLLDRIFEDFQHSSRTINTVIKTIIRAATISRTEVYRLGPALDIILYYRPDFELADPEGTLIEAVKGWGVNVEPLIASGLADVTDEVFEALEDSWWLPPESEGIKAISENKKFIYQVLLAHGEPPSKDSRAWKVLNDLSGVIESIWLDYDSNESNEPEDNY